ncbi:MAG: GntR family transcriptional regulator, partial [Planctomycetota bacterium]|nr:GntR family transcriptional regulator [Planctomycetota bacterium]
YSYLRKKLARGEFPAGSQLVNRTLAQEIGVSLSPVREAINRLAEEGLVKQVPGAGAFVRDFSREDLEETYIVREAVEGCAAAEAARNIRAREIEELEEICRRWLELVRAIRNEPDKMATVEQASAWADMDEHFHAVLVAASHNSRLQKIVREGRLLSRIFKTTRNVPEVIALHGAAWTWREHVQMVRAIRNRDPDRARDLMVHSIARGRRTVMENLRREQDHTIREEY